jgi:hypothetical protein
MVNALLQQNLPFLRNPKRKGKKRSYSEACSWLIHTSLKNVCLSMKVIIEHHDH